VSDGLPQMVAVAAARLDGGAPFCVKLRSQLCAAPAPRSTGSRQTCWHSETHTPATSCITSAASLAVLSASDSSPSASTPTETAPRCCLDHDCIVCIRIVINLKLTTKKDPSAQRPPPAPGSLAAAAALRQWAGAAAGHMHGQQLLYWNNPLLGGAVRQPARVVVAQGRVFPTFRLARA
jgi:hypothetical protein